MMISPKTRNCLRVFRKVCFLLLAVASVGFGLLRLHYSLTTLSTEQCVEYMGEHSRRGAKTFDAMADSRYSSFHMYWVARDGDPTKAQEIFVFRLAPFLGRFYGNERRYRFVVSNITDEMNTEKIAPVGFLQFRPRNDKGEKELRDTVLFFGNMQAGRPRRCVLALKTQAGETEENGYIHMLDSTYLVILPDVGDGRRLVKAEFYSKRDDLLYAYVP